MSNNTQINNTSYYQLPCGKFLEDFIYHKRLNFNMGSALKYMWRAGHKDGESEDKDLKKAEHYIRFEAKCSNPCYNEESCDDCVEITRGLISTLMKEAKEWDGSF